MPDYSNSKLYKIWSPSHPGEIYIGSTTQSLARRMVGHRTKYKQYLNGKCNYTTSFKIIEYGDAKIELIEKVECKDKEELTASEGYYIRTLNCVNKKIEGRTKKEWYQDNKEDIAQREKKYREANREIINRRREQYYKNNRMTCECGSVIRRDYLRMHKKTKKHMEYIKNVVSSCHTLPE